MNQALWIFNDANKNHIKLNLDLKWDQCVAICFKALAYAKQKEIKGLSVIQIQSKLTCKLSFYEIKLLTSQKT